MAPVRFPGATQKAEPVVEPERARRDKLIQVAIGVRDRFCKGGERTPWDINDGLCEEWARAVKDEAEQNGITGLIDFDIHEFFSPDREGEPCFGECGFDVRCLKRYGLKDYPEGLDRKDLKSPEFTGEFGTHIWVYDLVTKLHFDAEAVHGVPSLLDLPIFQRSVHRYLAEKVHQGGDGPHGLVQALRATGSSEFEVLSGLWATGEEAYMSHAVALASSWLRKWAAVEIREENFDKDELPLSAFTKDDPNWSGWSMLERALEYLGRLDGELARRAFESCRDLRVPFKLDAGHLPWLKTLPEGLWVEGCLVMVGSENFEMLPKRLRVDGKLDMENLPKWDYVLPRDLRVESMGSGIGREESLRDFRRHAKWMQRVRAASAKTSF